MGGGKVYEMMEKKTPLGKLLIPGRDEQLETEKKKKSTVRVYLIDIDIDKFINCNWVVTRWQ